MERTRSACWRNLGRALDIADQSTMHEAVYVQCWWCERTSQSFGDNTERSDIWTRMDQWWVWIRWRRKSERRLREILGDTKRNSWSIHNIRAVHNCFNGYLSNRFETAFSERVRAKRRFTTVLWKVLSWRTTFSYIRFTKRAPLNARHKPIRKSDLFDFISKQFG